MSQESAPQTPAMVCYSALLESLPYQPDDAVRLFTKMIEICGLQLDTPDTLQGDIEYLIERTTTLKQPYSYIINLRKSYGAGKGIDFSSVKLTLSVAQQRYLQLTMPNEPVRSALMGQGIDEQAYAISPVLEPNPVQVPWWNWRVVALTALLILFALIILWPIISKVLGLG